MKKTILTTTLFLFFTISMFAQKDWAFGTNISPNFTFRTKVWDDPYQGQIGYHFGLNTSVFFNEKLALTTGIKLSKYTEIAKINTLGLVTESDLIGGEPDPVLENIGTIDLEPSYFFMGIPIGLRVYLGGKKIKFFVEPNIEPQFHLTNNQLIVKSEIDGTFTEEKIKNIDNNFRPINFALGLSFGIEVPFSDSFFLTFQPNYNIHLLPTANNVNFKGARLYSLGGQLGIYYLMSN